jgi:hypothetical protein
MIVPLLWAAAALAPQGAQIDPTLAAYQKMVKPYQNAAAIHLECTSEMLINPDAIGLELSAGETPSLDKDGLVSLGKIKSSIHFAKPSHGSSLDRGSLDFMSEKIEFNREHVGNGEAIFLLDHLEKSYEGPVGLSEIDSPLLEIPALGTWFGRPGPNLDTLDQLPNDPAHQAMTGFRIQTHDTVIDMWFDLQGMLKLASSSTMDEGHTLQTIRMSFDHVELLTKVEDLKLYVKAIPKDYVEETFDSAGELDSFENAFIPVGRSAPPANFTDMNGESLTLASLKGKTVLLNFWFYH